ncbi:MAG: glycosyltransferase [Myxococcota bacterium]|nr:glycosyltransferase [Deltaproteobacteria bacterium]MDQ3336729.1 glycosyltransferase [Myxococcota bacterium]
MRVLHVCGIYLPATEWGGPTYAVANYAEALQTAGVECEVFTTTARGDRNLPPLEPGTRDVRGVRVTYFPAAPVHQSFIAPAMATALARRVREFDLVHTHMLWAFPGIAASRIAHLRGVPYVVTPHGSLDPWSLEQRKWMKRAFLLASENATLRRAALVHYTATAERDAVPPRLRHLPSVIVPNVIEPSDLPRGPRSRDIVILGRIHVMKGFDILIPAMRAVLAKRDARLVIAGPDEGGYRAEVERMIAEAGIGAAVTFTGHIDLEARTKLLSTCSLLVQPSYRENFGMAVAEAMAQGVPVVVSDRVNICDDIAATGAGLVVPRDVTQLADAIVRVLDDPRTMGEAGRRLVRERYAPDVVGPAMRAAYDQAARTTPKRTASQ